MSQILLAPLRYRHRMNIRPYHPTDMPACLSIFDSNLPTYFAADERPDFERFLRDLAGRHRYQVIEREGMIVACGGLSPAVEGTAGFCWGMVERSRHRQGLGRALAHARLLQAGCDPTIKHVSLCTSQHTQGFYAALGFRVAQVVSDGHGAGIDAVHMQREAR